MEREADCSKMIKVELCDECPAQCARRDYCWERKEHWLRVPLFDDYCSSAYSGVGGCPADCMYITDTCSDGCVIGTRVSPLYVKAGTHYAN